jgi:hypothetical protein
MGYALISSGPTLLSKWAVAILNEKGMIMRRLPGECETESEARKYAESYTRLFG